MLNIAVAPMLIENLIEQMRDHLYSISIDGSNNTGLEKVNPAMVRIYDTRENLVVSRFLDMCPTISSTAESTLAEKLQSSNPWSMCTSLGAAVNIGTHNSLTTRMQRENSAVYVSGCPCHMIHNAERKGSDGVCNVSSFDVEE